MLFKNIKKIAYTLMLTTLFSGSSFANEAIVAAMPLETTNKLDVLGEIDTLIVLPSNFMIAEIKFSFSPIREIKRRKIRGGLGTNILQFKVPLKVKKGTVLILAIDQDNRSNDFLYSFDIKNHNRSQVKKCKYRGYKKGNYMICEKKENNDLISALNIYELRAKREKDFEELSGEKIYFQE
jgi:hypothetical protein